MLESISAVILFCLVLAGAGFALLKIPGMKLLFDDTACALQLGPWKTFLLMLLLVTSAQAVPLALAFVFWGDLPSFGFWKIILVFAGLFVFAMFFGLIAALATVHRIFGLRRYEDELERKIRRAHPEAVRILGSRSFDRYDLFKQK
jgi:hypothetical protein